jgi:membrane protease YdiL (CAAX protease family)
VAQLLPEPAGWRRAGLTPLAAFLAIAALLPLAVITARLPRHGDAVAAYSLVGEVLLGVAVVAASRPLVRTHGGWSRALGLAAPERSDGRRVLAWLGIQLGVRAGITLLLHVVAPDLPSAANLNDAGSLGPAGAALLLAAAVVIAPAIEELAFRGVLLRALMRRLPFWPAAAVSSFVFGLFHAPGASSPVGGVVLVLLIYTFGMLQCLLVRRTARLAPAIGVHAALNLLATTFALTGT